MSRLLVVLYGLPGAGKSTLAKGVGEALGGSVCHHISVDDLMGASEGEWTPAAREAWHAARATMILRVREVIDAAEAEVPLVVILDDNFQLKSMRKAVFHLARECTPGPHIATEAGCSSCCGGGLPPQCPAAACRCTWTFPSPSPSHATLAEQVCVPRCFLHMCIFQWCAVAGAARVPAAVIERMHAELVGGEGEYVPPLMHSHHILLDATRPT